MKTIFLALIFTGCFWEADSGERVLLRFPVLPAEVREIFGPHAFRVSFPEPGGGTFFLDTEEGADAAGVTFPPAPAVPVTASAVFSGRRNVLFPAGGLYPHGVDSKGEFSLTWENGFAADLMIRLASAGFPLERFNAGRFFREVLLRSAGNPWHLNEALILDTLPDLTFRADRIKLLISHSVVLAAPPGSWIPRNPLARPAETGTDGNCSFGYLPPGYHRYYRRNGEAGKVDILVGDGGTILYTVSGSW